MSRKPDPDKINQIVLASLWLTAHREGEGFAWSAWKGHDWDALNRLHEAGLIAEPRNKNKSITFTEEGAEAAEAAFQALCEAESEPGVDKIVAMPGIPEPPERHPFPPSAQRLWDTVPEEVQDDLLGNVWCRHCRGVCRIEDFTAIPDEHNDLILRGFCAACGHVVMWSCGGAVNRNRRDVPAIAALRNRLYRALSYSD